MEKNIKCKPNNLCIAIFTLCLSVRFVEYFLIETDKTVIGENALHKVAGIIILALVLKRIGLSWSDIGFQRNSFGRSIVKGLLFRKHLLFHFVWVRTSNFSSTRQSCTFRNIYQQFFFNRFSNKKYWLRFLFIMRTIQCRQCMDGGRCFSRSVY